MASLIEQMQADLRGIHEADFGQPVTLTAPSGASATVSGILSDVGRRVDPGTGLPISCRSISLSFSLRSLERSGLALPKAIAEGSILPWRATVATPGQREETFKIAEVNMDRTMGTILCLCEEYRA